MPSSAVATRRSRRRCKPPSTASRPSTDFRFSVSPVIGQTPDAGGPSTLAPHLTPVDARCVSYNLAELFERVADAVPEREAVVTPRRPAHVRATRRAGESARPCARGAWHRSGGSRRSTDAQRRRVHRDHARRVQAPRGAGERELPVRRVGARASLRRRRSRGPRVSRGVRTADQVRARAHRRSRAADRRRRRPRPDRRFPRVRESARTCVRRTRLRRTLGRRRVHGVHGRHDGHAQGSGVAPRGHLLRRHGRRRPDNARGAHLASRRDRRRGC